MKHILFWLWQWTWGFPQTFVGFIVYLICRKCPHGTYRGCIATRWNNRGSMGMGMFLFLGSEDPQVRVHEFGHSVQSLMLGPLFLPVMGIPSLLWCNLPPCQQLRREKGFSYYSLYTESTANYLGSLVTGEACNLR